MDNRDDEHLQILAIFHFVVAGLIAMVSLIPVIHLIMGLVVLISAGVAAEADEQAIATVFGLMFMLIPLLIILTGLSVATMIAIAGRCIQKRTRHLLCLIVAGVECCFVPFGTVLGVFTIIILVRDSVKQQFGVPVPPRFTPPPQTPKPPPLV